MPSHPHHNVQSPVRRSRLFALLMLSLPLFIIASPLQAIWEDSEYADLFANAPKTRSASPETVTSGAAEDADALHQADENLRPRRHSASHGFTAGCRLDAQPVDQEID